MQSRSSTLRHTIASFFHSRARPFAWASGKMVVVAVTFTLTGCALIPSTPLVVGANPIAIKVFQLTGRISVIQKGAGFFGGVRWRHRPGHDVILLFTPLGQGVARLVRDRTGVTLTTADKHYVALDAAQLTEKVLGWRLPLRGLRYWVRGLSAPGGGVAAANHLAQDGWQIEWSGYRTVAGFRLPGMVTMQRGTLRVKLVIDQWRVSQKAP